MISNFYGFDFELSDEARRKTTAFCYILYICYFFLGGEDYISLLWCYTMCLSSTFHYSVQIIITVLSFFGSHETENPKYIFHVYNELKCRREEVSNLHEVFHFPHRCVGLKKKYSATFALKREFLHYKLIFFHSVHIKPNISHIFVML